MNKIHTPLCAAFFALVLSSCINIEQDVWINEDGSGRVVIDMGISKEAEGMMSGLAGGLAESFGGAAGATEVTGNPFDVDTDKEEKKLLKNQYVTSAKVEKTTSEKYTHIIYTLEVSDITKLDEVQNEAMSDGPMGGDSGPSPEGEFSIEKTAAGTYKIVADLKGEGMGGGPDGGGEEMDAFAAGMVKQMLGDAAFTFRVHAPAIEHNGTEEDGAVVWTLPLADMATGKSLSITGEFKPAGGSGGGLTFWLVLAAVVVLAGVLFFVFQSQKPKLA